MELQQQTLQRAAPPGWRQAVGAMLAAAQLDLGTAEAAGWRSQPLLRLCAAMVTGAALGVAGVLLQSVIRNPLGEPHILGLNAGAALAVVLTSALGMTLPFGRPLVAAAGAAVVPEIMIPLVSARREVELVKIVTTIGKPGVAVASITRRPHNYVLTHVEGDQITVLNGQPIGTEPVALHSGDVLDLAGTQMQFLQR